jgi:two-component system, OmpR family, sensor kinase
MARWIGWLGVGILGVGVCAAFAVRWLAPATVLQFKSEADPASLLLLVALLAALVCLGAGALLRWREAQLNRAQAAQAEAQEERRRFIQRLDHELKNPLTAIQVQLDNLQESETPHPQSVADVRVQVGRLTQLTRGLRRLADLETRSLELEKVEIGELLDEVTDLLQTPDRIQLEVQHVPWPVPPLQADRELLLMVFRNLVDNALKYSSGPAQVRARDAAGHLVVDIIDTGRGIPAEELPLVIEELYRGSNTRDVAGSGLGLAMVQRIVERHGGQLELRSRQGQGTIATVQLPYEQTAGR